MNQNDQHEPGIYWQSRMGNNADGIGGNCHRYEVVFPDDKQTVQSQNFIVDYGIKMSNQQGMTGCQFPSPEGIFAKNGDEFVDGEKTPPSAIFLTHAHEDHIGGIRYAIDMGYQIPPVYCSPFTAQILAKSLTNAGIALPNWPKINITEPEQKVRVGDADIEFVPVDHMPGSCALFIKSEAASIFHTGDYKFDPTLTLGRRSDPARLKEIGQNGVDMVVSDSTSSENNSRKIYEKEIAENLSKLVAKNKGRAIIAGILGTQLDRLASLAKAAAENNRALVVTGRSLENNLTALQLAGIDLQKITGARILRPTEASGVMADKALVVTTGAFAQQNAGLSRIADHLPNALYVDDKTTVIIPQHAIPPVRRHVERMVDKLEYQGVRVITAEDAEKSGNGVIHQTGHAIEADTRLLYSLLKPGQLVVPVHGNEKQMKANADIAKSLGIKATTFNHNGMILRINNKEVENAGQEKLDRVVAIDSGEHRILPRAKAGEGRRDGPVPVYRYQLLADDKLNTGHATASNRASLLQRVMGR